MEVLVSLSRNIPLLLRLAFLLLGYLALALNYQTLRFPLLLLPALSRFRFRPRFSLELNLLQIFGRSKSLRDTP